jgi:hypothetical protein
MNNVYIEGNLQFTFSGYVAVEKFDDKLRNPFGMKPVDFIAESADKIYFLEVKDYQHPRATRERIDADLDMLQNAFKKGKSNFCLEMGQKLKDSLLRKYAQDYTFSKDVVFLFLINFDKLGIEERLLLKSKIDGFVPTGLNADRFPAFTSISFDLVNAEQLKNYGIICTEKVEV